MSVKNKIERLLKDLNNGVLEKEEIIAMSLLTAIAGESIFLLGAPGVAKSLIARRLKYAFTEGSSFEYLMNRFSTPDEIFGPISISKLKDHDKYERLVDNYLPSAKVVFLDEIWKAGPSIQNTLLTVLNEKKYRNGDKEIDVPMKALISASNELPMKGEGLDALWDRFLVRYVVEGVTDQKNFNEMISNSLKSYEDNVQPDAKIEDSEYSLWYELINEVEVPENVFNVIHIIRSYIQVHNNKEENKENQIYISDRRWKKIVRLLRTSAFLNDRAAVDLMDCFLIAHCIWNEPEQHQKVQQFVKDAILKHGYTLNFNLSDIKSELQDFNDDVIKETSFLKPYKKTKLKSHEVKYCRIMDYSRNMAILISDYTKLETSNLSRINLYQYGRHYNNQYSEYTSISAARGKKNSIRIDSQEYALETEVEEGKKAATKQPHPAVKKEWDKKIKVLLTSTGNLKSRIESYRRNDLKHLRVNLFVNPELAKYVESNLNDAQKDIEKLEIEVTSIKHQYETVEDQTGTKETKQLTSGQEG